MELRRHFNVEEGQTPFSGHHIGIYASFVTYDFQFGNHTGVLADKFNYATGISYGYTLPLRNRLSLEFSVGVGYLWGRYEKHRPIDDHDVWQSTHRQHRFGPTRAGISLVWLLGAGNTNRKKGGSR